MNVDRTPGVIAALDYLGIDVGTMKAIIMRWAAREPECMESLEYLATH